MCESALLQAEMSSSRKSRNRQGAAEPLPAEKAGVWHACSASHLAKTLWFPIKDRDLAWDKHGAQSTLSSSKAQPADQL